MKCWRLNSLANIILKPRRRQNPDHLYGISSLAAPGMGNIGWKVDTVSRLKLINIVTYPNLECPFQNQAEFLTWRVYNRIIS